MAVRGRDVDGWMGDEMRSVHLRLKGGLVGELGLGLSCVDVRCWGVELMRGCKVSARSAVKVLEARFDLLRDVYM